MGIQGEPDDQGNIREVVEVEEKEDEKVLWGFIHIATKSKKKVSQGQIIWTLQDVMSKRIGMDYDPNVIVQAAAASLLEDLNGK